MWHKLKADIPELSEAKTHFNDWNEEKLFAEKAASNLSEAEGSGIHAFCNKDIFAAVYITNLLMRACDVLVTKPSELAFYPVPKLFIRRVGGHEMWGAIHSAEIGDGTQECETVTFASEMIKQLIENPKEIEKMCHNIIKNKELEIYDGAYKVVRLSEQVR